MLVYGKNVAIELINKKHKINKIYVYNNFSDKSMLQGLSCPIKYVGKDELDKLVDGNHQGIVLDIPNYKYHDLDELIIDNSLIVMLDHIEDPHNLGAIIRTCEAAKVSGIIIPKDRGVDVNGTVMKTSAGTLDNVAIVQVTNLVNTIKYLKNNGFWIVGTDMMGTNYSEIDYSGKTCIIIGNEGSGMSRLVKENCDFIASIPMKGQINSLNASVAAGIIIFEATRKRG